MKRRKFSIYYLTPLAFFGMVGCSSLKQSESGFLTNYEELEAGSDSSEARWYFAEGVSWNEFDSTYLTEVAFILPPRDKGKLSEEDLASIQGDINEIVFEEFSRKFNINTDIDSADLIVRVGVTRIDTANVGLNALTGILAVPVDKGGVGIDLEIVERSSGRRLLAVSAIAKGKISQVGGFFERFRHALNGTRSIVSEVVQSTSG